MASEKIGKSRLFIIFSFLFISAMIIIYGGRFIYFYRLTHMDKEIGTSLLSSVVTTLSPDNKSIKTDGQNTYYVGNVLNNFVYYSGRYYRILGVNDNKVVMVDNNISTILSYNSDNYIDSDIYKWLNKTDEDNTGIYYNSLKNPEDYLDITKTCIDVYETKNNGLKCNNYNESSVGVITMFDYIKATENGKNYLNMDSYYWLTNKGEDNSIWYIDNNNSLNVKSNTVNYGIRAVITLKPDVLYNGGSGTMFDPYTITEEDAKMLGNIGNIDYSSINFNNINIGSYISYSDKLWQIMSFDGEKIKLVLNDTIEPISFSKKSNIYNLNDKTGVAYYLNNTFYNSLQNKEYLVKGDFYIGDYKDTYLDIFNKKVNCYIGMLEIGNLFISDISDTFTLTNNSIEDTVYKVIEGRLYADSYEAKNKIRPVIYLKNSLVIKNGYGTIDAPYEVGEV